MRWRLYSRRTGEEILPGDTILVNGKPIRFVRGVPPKRSGAGRVFLQFPGEIAESFHPSIIYSYWRQDHA